MYGNSSRSTRTVATFARIFRCQNSPQIPWPRQLGRHYREKHVAGAGHINFRQVPPRRPRPQDPEDAIEDTPVVHAGNAARLVREHRFDDAAFAVTEFIAHDSMLSFGSLNHVRDHGINGQTACPLLGDERTYGRHSDIDAIDPKLTHVAFAIRLQGSPGNAPVPGKASTVRRFADGVSRDVCNTLSHSRGARFISIAKIEAITRMMPIP
jgi:hypothetical protein